MKIDSTHPLYDEYIQDQNTMRILYRGERAVKDAGVTFLPATPGQEIDGMNTGNLGRKNYEAYKTRAVFHDIVSDAVQNILGNMHNKASNFELEGKLKSLIEKATLDGEPLSVFMMRVNEEQLVPGRLGVLLDISEKGEPYLSIYTAEACRNWHRTDGKMQMVILDESGYELQDDLSWEMKVRYRLLRVKDGVYTSAVYEKDGTLVGEEIVPMVMGNKLDEIPFTFINAKDIVDSPDRPPLLGLGNLALAIYRAEADYRHALFMQGQDTFVVVGNVISKEGEENGDVRVGAGSMVQVEQGGDARYEGVSSSGLSEQRQAIEADKKQAYVKAGQLFGSGGDTESGVAMNIRLTSMTANLNRIALSGAAGVERVLKIGARWFGISDTGVSVVPNLDFENPQMDPSHFKELVAGFLGGAIPASEFVRNMQEAGIFTEEKTVEQLLEEIGAVVPPSGE